MELPASQYIYTKEKINHKKRNIFLGCLAIVLVFLGLLVSYMLWTNNGATVLAPLAKITHTQVCKTQTSAGNYKKGTSAYPALDFPNNKVGVYSYADTPSINMASKMVNSNGGDWGWVLIPFNIKQLNVDYWNSVMENLCSDHLIPVLQLFNDSKPPTDSETAAMADFLSKLKWPTTLKFITAYNEVNASEYWGGKVDPESYAHVLDTTITDLKNHDKNFFIMNGAFNSSARNNPGFKTDLGVFTAYMNLPDYLDRMNKAVPGIFKKLDSWASHCYPFPAYQGKPTDTRVTGESDYEAGRNTIRSYQYDLRVLKDNFGVTPPVFITETGWPHAEGTTYHPEWLPAATVAQYYKAAFEDLYLPDSQVIAVMPFIMEMKGVDNFAFVDSKGNLYPQYQTILDLKKTKGAPEIN